MPSDKTLFQCNPVKAVHDSYFTRKSAWENIELYIPRGKIIWEPFYDVQSNSASHWTEFGFNVIWKNQDFFTSNEGDIVVSNPPFSQKKEVFTRLKELNEPFILLVPTTVIQTKYFQDLYRDEHIQFIIPYKKINFDKLGDDGEMVDNQKDNCSFYTLYVCWKMNFARDVIFI